jgi:glycosyltransferase involved in cell wall biosynthesis
MHRRNRILVLVPSSKTHGGIGHYFKTIKPFLLSDVTFFIRGVRNQQSLAGKLVFPIIQVYDTGRFFFYLLFGRYSLVQINTSFGITGIIRDAIFILITRLFNKKHLVFFRGIDDVVIKQVEKKYWWIFRNTFLNANRILVLSNKMKEIVLDWGYAGKVIIETTIVDSNLLKDFNIEQQFRKYETGNYFEILFLSRLEKGKGIYEAIDAFRILNIRQPRTILRICGDGKETTKVLNYAGENLNRNIFFEGFVTGARKSQIFSMAHIFLFPSYAEGMPNALLEAIAFGLPVITSDVGGISDFFIQPQMGYITRSIQPDVLAGLLERLIEYPEKCQNISRFNYEFAKIRYYSEIVAGRFDSCYSELLNG